MKRNAEKSTIEAGCDEAGVSVLETPRQSNGVNTAETAGNAHRPRPEIAVLGWDVRSYRLSLRSGKA